MRTSVIAAVVVAAVSVVRPSAQTGGSGTFVAGDVLVAFRPGVGAGARANAHGAAGATPLLEIPSSGVLRVRVAAGGESDAIARYRRNPNVLYAEPNFIRRIPTPLALASDVDPVPGDYYFDEQWALHNTGQPFQCIAWLGLCLYSGTPDADIDAPEAWAILTGSAAVSVAVIDTGIDYTSPDLAPNYAGGDDFVFDDGDPMDDQGHGTHVAGTIAAALNNSTGNPPAAEGVVGVAPHARLLAYKVCRSDGTCDDFAIQRAIARAVADGAKVINMSLGDSAYSQSLNDAVQAAWSAGVVIVAGAGNDGTTAPFYPAALENVVSVAAFDEDHRRPAFSNYGSWVDIAAPGNVIMSTYPMAACGSSTTPGDTGCYAWNTGTSMATPHVAGAAALVWARSDVTSHSQVVDILLRSADPRGVSAPRLDTWTIHGGLNLHNAVRYGVTNLPPVPDAGPDQTLADGGGDGTETVTLDGSASSDLDGTIVTYAWREGAAPLGTGATLALALSTGPHTLTLEVTDDSGDTATDEVVVTVNPANEVTVAASAAQAAEADSATGAFTVSRAGDASAPLTVRYALGGSAEAGADYASLPGTVTIEAGSSTATVTLTPIDDAIYETDESVILTIRADSTYAVGTPGAATVTIASDDLPPDLAVPSLTVPAIGGADADITVTDTTRNQGTGVSFASATGFYLSVNTVLDPADVLLGTRPVPSLGPGATHAVSTTLRIPPATTTGTYYVIAKADWDGAVPENVETNNVRAGSVRVGPDLIVSAVTAPATAGAGSTITISDTTKNQGGGGAPSSTTRFYLSTNTSVDPTDVVLGSRTAPALAAGAVDAVSTALVLPAATVAGTYYVVAQADAESAVPESIETNQTKASGALKIGADLVVTSVAAPATAAPGATISATETTKNQGAGRAAASATGFYLSANATFDATDVFLGSRSVGELDAGATATGSTPLQIPANTTPGRYYVVSRADWDGAVAETAESNNDRSSGAVGVGGDLVLTALSAPGTAAPNRPMTVTDTTKNQGAAAVPESATGFYLSTNGSLSADDVFLGSRAAGPIAAGATDLASTPLVVPSGTTPGTYYVIGVADWNGAIAESTESNNTRSSASVRIGADLIVGALTGPSSAAAGAGVTVGDTTTNQGADGAPASVTRFYLSSNSSIDASDVLLGARSVPALGPNQSSAGSTVFVIPAGTAPGTYYVIAKSDGDGSIAESLESNNTRTRSMSITAPPP